MSKEGLAKVEQIYWDRGGRAKGLKSEGKKIMGYFCCYTPLEILTAANLVPYRIMGNAKEPIGHAAAYLEDITCSFIRSCFTLALKGSYDFCDGFIMPHTCDHIVKLYNIWRLNLKPPFSHFINVPHTLSQPSYEFFEAEIGTFKKSIERFIQCEITNEQIGKAIELHNQNRALVRELYELNKEDPLLSGVEIIKTLIAVMSLPVEEGNELLRGVIKEIKGRSAGPEKKARVLICGPQIDDPTFIELVEESGANVVIDDLCTGTKHYWPDVEITNDSLKAIAARYLGKLTCPRAFKPRVGTHQEDLRNRFGYIRDFAKEFKVSGIILYIIRFCDTFGFDSSDMKEYLEGEGFPIFVSRRSTP